MTPDWRYSEFCADQADGCLVTVAATVPESGKRQMFLLQGVDPSTAGHVGRMCVRQMSGSPKVSMSWFLGPVSMPSEGG